METSLPIGIKEKRGKAILPAGVGRLRDAAEGQPPEWGIAVGSDMPGGHCDRWRGFSRSLRRAVRDGQGLRRVPRR